jgi:hypothetical protein
MLAYSDNLSSGRLLREIASALDINEYLQELTRSARPLEGVLTGELQDLLGQVALLRLLSDSLREPQAERVVLWPVDLSGRQPAPAARLLRLYGGRLAELGLELDASHLAKEADREPQYAPGKFLIAQGPHALAVLRPEGGIHLFPPAHGAVLPLRLLVLPLAADADPAALLCDWSDRRQHWLQAVGRGEVAVTEDPLTPGPVVRIYSDPRDVLDLRTGLTGEVDLAACLLAALPLPPEITDPEPGLG